jgi:dTDP-4-dehydrorhamnose reductase
MTSVEECEVKRGKAFVTNVLGTQNLASYCKNTLLVYVSSACVFKGDRGDYNENEVPDPYNNYGLTKFLAELSVETICTNYLIVRTNFVARRKWPYPRAFVDRFGTYLYADQVAKAIKELVNKGLRGVVHVCGDKKISMFELAKLTTPNVKPMRLSDYTGKAKLTKDMSLVSVRINHYALLGDF